MSGGAWRRRHRRCRMPECQSAGMPECQNCWLGLKLKLGLIGLGHGRGTTWSQGQALAYCPDGSL